MITKTHSLLPNDVLVEQQGNTFITVLKQGIGHYNELPLLSEIDEYILQLNKSNKTIETKTLLFEAHQYKHQIARLKAESMIIPYALQKQSNFLKTQDYSVLEPLFYTELATKQNVVSEPTIRRMCQSELIIHFFGKRILFNNLLTRSKKVYVQKLMIEAVSKHRINTTAIALKAYLRSHHKIFLSLRTVGYYLEHIKSTALITIEQNNSKI
jgi:hypothetical protein